jgi:RecA-family ATPase
VSAFKPILTAQQIASALGGHVDHEGRVRAPGPNHRPGDGSLTIWVNPSDPDGFTVNSHSTRDTWEQCRDYVRQRLGLSPFNPCTTKQEPKPRARRIAEYVYETEDRARYLKVTRWERPNEPKWFTQSHWTGSSWASGKPDGPKLPYRLPELLAAPNAPVFICEGEKHADRLAELGLVATSASGGAEKWTADLNRWFVGRQVLVLPDNDEVGEKHAQQVARFLQGVAQEVRLIRLPDLPPKGDVSDWLDAGGERRRLIALADVAPAWDPTEAATEDTNAEEVEQPAPCSVPFVTGAELLSRPIQRRRFLAGEAIPMGQVTDLRGDGKTGKSTLAIQLCVAAAAGCPWLGMPVETGPAIYLASEDDEAEVHRRLQAIATECRLPDDKLSNFHVWPLAIDDPALVVVEKNKLVPTRRWWELVAKVEAVGPVVVVLDSRADVFAGEEMNRQQVRTFVGMLRGLAIKTGAAVVLLSHPSLSGMADGTGNSGSTHWTNAVRSVLYLQRPKGDHIHPDVRELTFGPSNYAAGGAPALPIRWSVGAFVLDGGAPRSTSRQEAEAEADQIFLRLLAKFTAQGRRVRASAGHGYAPSLFAKQPEAGGISKRGFEAAMERLFEAQKVEVRTEGPPSKTSSYLAAKEL